MIILQLREEDDRQKSQARTIREKIPDIEDRVAGDQAAAYDQDRQFIFRQIFIAGLPWT